LRRNRRNRASSRSRVNREREEQRVYRTQGRWVQLEMHTVVSINTLKYKQTHRNRGNRHNCIEEGGKCSICSCQLSRVESLSGSRRGDRSREISRDSRRRDRARCQSGNRSRGSKRKGPHLINTIYVKMRPITDP
jgi:hypothetical protein